MLEDVENILERLSISNEDFHYIADSALFISENLKKAESRNLKLITRMPKTNTLAKKFIREALNNKSKMKEYYSKNFLKHIQKHLLHVTKMLLMRF